MPCFDLVVGEVLARLLGIEVVLGPAHQLGVADLIPEVHHLRLRIVLAACA